VKLIEVFNNNVLQMQKKQQHIILVTAVIKGLCLNSS